MTDGNSPSVPDRPRYLTGLTPTGHLHIGNLLAAIAPIVGKQKTASDVLVFLADLSALTVDHDPRTVADITREQAAILLASGVDPDRSTLFVQSQIPELTALHYLIESTASYGEAARMIQFKEKARRAGESGARLSLLTYPALMAADILLYDSHEVPVGDDQSQHVEFARDVARRFNRRYGETFVVPRAVHPPVGARVMDLAHPGSKMSKSDVSGAGVLFVLDPPDVLRRKIRRAVTDANAGGVEYSALAPAVANLIDLLALIVDEKPDRVATRYSSYGALKADLADAVIATLEPIQREYAMIAADQAELDRTVSRGGERARTVAAPALRRAQRAIGLLPVPEVAGRPGGGATTTV